MNENNEIEKRIIYRRQRIEKRNRVLRGESVDEVVKERDDRDIHKQIEESNTILERLTLEGNDLVSSVAVAGITREVNRRAREAQSAERRSIRIAKENDSAIEQLDFIRSKWSNADGQCDALELNDLLQQQRRSCKQLLDQKDGLAELLRKELEDRRSEYEQTLKDQGTELALAADRVDQHVAALKEAQTNELALLETVIENTRKLQVSRGENKWLELWDDLHFLQKKQDENREELSDTLGADEDNLHEQMAEKLHEARVQLQQQTQVLALELQGLKASCCLNAEKMKLNTELLRTRDKEARVMKSTQKRRINKLQDKIRALRIDVTETRNGVRKRRKNLRDKVKKLQLEIDKSNNCNNVTQIQIKMLVENGIKQIKNLIKQIIKIDEILTTQQLCMPWNEPDKLNLKIETIALSLMDTRFMFNNINIKNRIMSTSTSSASSSSTDALQQASSLLIQSDNIKERKMNQFILKSLIDATVMFLSPDHPGKKLKNISDQEKMLMELASCLSALGIETETDLICLFNTLRPLTSCKTCKEKPFNIETTICKKHEPIIKSDSILKNIKLFTANRAVEADDVEAPPIIFNDDNKTPPPPLHEDNISHIGWEEFYDLIPNNLEEMWDRLYDGLNQHLTVLQDRNEINLQVIKLQEQNTELRYLLQSYALPKIKNK